MCVLRENLRRTGGKYEGEERESKPKNGKRQNWGYRIREGERDMELQGQGGEGSG